MHTGIGTSHAKIILIGDHSVVYGEPAICLPLKAVPCRITVAAQPTGEPDWLTTSFFTGPLSSAQAIYMGPWRSGGRWPSICGLPSRCG
ncbi:hypothetical protein [Schleiferilactobacillus harbinensis]|uniref:hypothetical protein n=1 Tax=Schleiferilactobacillus harbinensis TaxID=304207 RepID=UPI00186B35E2|nr:hypothetical protein [Schleiferilactobacillus harbinensis]